MLHEVHPGSNPVTENVPAEQGTIRKTKMLINDTVTCNLNALQCCNGQKQKIFSHPYH